MSNCISLKRFSANVLSYALCVRMLLCTYWCQKPATTRTVRAEGTVPRFVCHKRDRAMRKAVCIKYRRMTVKMCEYVCVRNREQHRPRAASKARTTARVVRTRDERLDGRADATTDTCERAWNRKKEARGGACYCCLRERAARVLLLALFEERFARVGEPADSRSHVGH